MKSACVIVMGHVDHGKTTLVRALTGMETDTLDQEKQRGLSINLGFAYCRTPSGNVDLIDAPGHEDFIRTMVAGATGAQAAMLVISAVDGIAAQTVEHLRIAKLLAVPVRFVVVTKTDLIPPADLENRLDDLRCGLSDLGVSHIPLTVVSAELETGYQALLKGLEGLLNMPPALHPPEAAFLPIDRVFTIPGRGTVVTGTLLGGDLALSDGVDLHPQNQPAAIRGLQSRGQNCARVPRGARVAVNLRGIAPQDITKGDVLGASGRFAASDCLDVELTLLGDASHVLKHMSKVRVLFGTAHAVATLRLMGGGQVAPDQKAFAQLRFTKPVTLFAGQRLVLRSLSPPETIGGAVVLDPQASAAKSGDAMRLAMMRAAVTGDARQIATALCDQGKGIARLADVARLARLPEAGMFHTLASDFTPLDGALVALNQTLAAQRADVLQKLAAFHNAHPIKRSAPRKVVHSQTFSSKLSAHVLGTLQGEGLLWLCEDQIALTRHDPWAALDQSQLNRLAQIDATLKDAGVMPPDIQTVPEHKDDPDLLDLLVAEQKAVPLFNVALKQRLVFHQDALLQAAETLRRIFPPPMSFTTGQAREALGTSRKFIVPLLEYFDIQHITIRQGDARHMTKP